ncbi:hypothetical protein EJB05_40885, partial [Eragrostis curvula]
MRAPASLLHATTTGDLVSAASPSPAGSGPEQQNGAAVDSDMVVILASFLCALVCVLGLALVSRCACRLRRSSSSSSSAAPPPPKGLKKKAIDALPIVSFTPAAAAMPCPPAASGGECAICLAEFAEGEELRVLLPRCAHAFHVACIDAWLRTRATCPSCRASLVVAPRRPWRPQYRALLRVQITPSCLDQACAAGGCSFLFFSSSIVASSCVFSSPLL